MNNARPLFISDVKPMPLTLRLSVYLVLAAGLLYLGAALHSTWTRSNPCSMAPGGSITEVIPVDRRSTAGSSAGANRQTTTCKSNGDWQSVQIWRQGE